MEACQRIVISVLGLQFGQLHGGISEEITLIPGPVDKIAEEKPDGGEDDQVGPDPAERFRFHRVLSGNGKNNNVENQQNDRRKRVGDEKHGDHQDRSKNNDRLGGQQLGDADTRAEERDIHHQGDGPDQPVNPGHGKKRQQQRNHAN